MIKVGFITSPTVSGHAVRGVGFYTLNLLSPLIDQAPRFGIEIISIEKPQDLASAHLDLIHYPYFDLFYPTLRHFPPAKSVVTVHDVIPLLFPQVYRPGLRGSLNFFRQRLSLSRSALVITDSFSAGADIHRHLHLDHSRIKVVHLAASEKFSPRQPKELHRLEAKYHLPAKFVMYVGDVNYPKNLPQLVHACRSLSVPLVIAGLAPSRISGLDLSHPELAHLRSIVSDLGPPHVFTLGFVPPEDLPGLYCLAQVYCQPSLAEGFGIPVLEAMACGTPVVCSNASSLPEVGGSAAIYFDPQNLSEITSTLDQVLRDSRLRRKLSQAGQIQASKFSWDKTAQSTLMVYREALSV